MSFLPPCASFIILSAMKQSGRLAFAVGLAVFCAGYLLCGSSLVHAAPADPARVEFNDGSLILGYAWWDEDELILYTVNPYGAIMWRHQVLTGARDKLLSATELAQVLGKQAAWEEPSFQLSPHRRYIAFYSPPGGPVATPLFRVVDLQTDRRSAMRFSKTPEDFLVGSHVWDDTDKYVYVAAQPFSAVESQVSLGRLSLETGAFMPLARKEQVDLISGLAYDPFTNSLVVTARSFGGEYPRGEFLLRYSLSDNALVLLHEAYQYRGVEVVATGQILAGAVAKEAFKGGSFPGFLMVDESFELPETPVEGGRARYVSRILLFPPDGEPETLLTSQDRGFDFQPALSPRGDYLGFLRLFYRLPYAVRVRMPEHEVFLCLKERNGPQEYLVMRDAESFCFSPGSHYLAARASDKSYLLVFELPRTEAG